MQRAEEDRWTWSLRPGLVDGVVLFLLLAVATLGTHRLFGDSDPATHVATGGWILDNRAIPRTDPFSATHGGRSWFAHEWLADVLWAWAYRAAGWQGLLALSAALVASSHALLYRSLVRRGDDPLVAAAVVLAAAVVASSHWLARPHLLSVLLLVAWVAVIEGVARGSVPLGRLALLPLLSVLWANLHGGFLVGLVVGACYLAGILVDAWRATSTSRWTHARIAGALAAALAVAGLGTLVNPWGWRLPAHLLFYFASPREALVRNAEFAPASFGDRAGITVYGFLAVCVFALGLHALAIRRSTGTVRPLPPHPGTLLALGATSAMTVASIRHAEIMAVFGAWIVSGSLTAWTRLSPGQGGNEFRVSLARHERRHGGALAAVAMIALAALAASGRPLGAGYDPGAFPVAMVARLRAARIVPRGPVFSRDLWGGYLILEWPESRVFVDGRSDMYGDAFMREYAEIYEARTDWRRQIERRGVTWALLPRDAPLVLALDADPAWERWGSDDVAIVFRRRSP